MPRFFRHEKRPAWGIGRLVEDHGDRLALLFEDGKERALVVGAPGLVEVAAKAVPKKSSARAVSATEAKTKLSKVQVSRLIKAVRLAIRDGLALLKSEGAFPDDTLVEMQKGLSRITADHARFGGTKPAVVRKVTAASARTLHDEHGRGELFAELAVRIEDCPAAEYEGRTRAYADPEDATKDLDELHALLSKGADVKDRDIDRLIELLTPTDLKDARD